MEVPCGVVVGWLGTATVTTQGLNSSHDTTKSGDFLLATTGDRYLATSGDFFMAHGHPRRSLASTQVVSASRRTWIEAKPALPSSGGGERRAGVVMPG